MSKQISEAGLPYGIHYQIHSHNGLQGPERIPHVHIKGKGCEVKYSLIDASYIEGSFNGADESSISRWVRDNLYDLKIEWDRADDPAGGR